MTDPKTVTVQERLLDASPLAEFVCVRRQGDYVLIAVTPKSEETQRFWVSVGGAEILAAELAAILTQLNGGRNVG